MVALAALLLAFPTCGAAQSRTPIATGQRGGVPSSAAQGDVALKPYLGKPLDALTTELGADYEASQASDGRVLIWRTTNSSCAPFDVQHSCGGNPGGGGCVIAVSLNPNDVVTGWKVSGPPIACRAMLESLEDPMPGAASTAGPKEAAYLDRFIGRSAASIVGKTKSLQVAYLKPHTYRWRTSAVTNWYSTGSSMEQVFTWCVLRMFSDESGNISKWTLDGDKKLCPRFAKMFAKYAS